MRKKDVQHQRRHRKKPSKWRFVWTVVTIIARLLSKDWDFWE